MAGRDKAKVLELGASGVCEWCEYERSAMRACVLCLGNGLGANRLRV